MNRSVLRLAAVTCVLSIVVAVPSEAKKRKGEKDREDAWKGEIDHVEVVKPFHVADYGTLYIEPLDTTEVADLPDEDDNSHEPAMLVLGSHVPDLVEGFNEFARDKGLAVDAVAVAPAEPSLVLRGAVTRLNPGSRAARYFASFGAGSAKVEISGEIVDAATGEVLVRFRQERWSGVGMFGGDYEKLLRRNLRQIGEDIAFLLREL